ncbi:MAG TPA: lipoyl(octanoyl) transferase LipB [Candidatus Binatia bacterium]|nr:lipoyl(octanoyl) transferase LipB [Candidatus Binatia bacterium]
MVELVYQNLASMDYLAAFALQEELVRRKQREATADFILFLEHPHVYTVGRGGKLDHVLAPGDVPVHRTGRGGDVTYHGPGQLVVYPIVDLRSKLRKDVHRYVRNLEQTAIVTLADFGLPSIRRPPYTGIWIADRKIAAIGVAVRRGVTYHGLALNVNVDLSYFNRIVPCGLSWAGVTSMAKELGSEQSFTGVRHAFLHHFAAIFGYSEIREGELDGDPLTGECGIKQTPEKYETRNPELGTAL